MAVVYIYKTKERGLEGEEGIYAVFIFYLRVVIGILELLFSFT